MLMRNDQYLEQLKDSDILEHISASAKRLEIKLNKARSSLSGMMQSTSAMRITDDTDREAR